jgi:hypothetical protein
VAGGERRGHGLLEGNDEDAVQGVSHVSCLRSRAGGG